AWGIDNHDALVVWGDVDEDGAFTKQGERSFGAHGVALACSRMHLERGAPVMWVATRDEHCEAHRLDLAAGQLGKPRPLCRVWAAVGDDAFGIDDAGKPAHVDGLGTVSRTAVTADSDVVGTTVVTRQQATVRRWDAPFKKPPRTMTLGKLPIDTTAPADVIATNDGVVLVQRQRRGDEPMLAVWFDMKGTSHGSSGFGDPGMGQHACAIGDKGLVCAWGDEAAAKIYALTLNPETP
ncbi:MAG: hypothetical protein JO257_15100, partial [Deltaproteobacteria bacterium]|nr:hypothetical protein [Deltaproteobacteria bacterium]